MRDIKQIERDLEQLWENFRTEPPRVYFDTEFGYFMVDCHGVWINFEDEEGDNLGFRKPTDEELARFRKEFPSMCK